MIDIKRAICRSLGLFVSFFERMNHVLSVWTFYFSEGFLEIETFRNTLFSSVQILFVSLCLALIASVITCVKSFVKPTGIT